MIATAILTSTIPLFLSLYHDIRYLKIPNTVTFPGILLGLIVNGMAGKDYFLGAIEGLLLGILLLLLPFALRGIGAGDVKLLGCLGAFAGPHLILYTALFMALSGGLISLIQLIRSSSLRSALSWIFLFLLNLITSAKEPPPAPALAPFPYGIAIVIGYGLALTNQFFWSFLSIF